MTVYQPNHRTAADLTAQARAAAALAQAGYELGVYLPQVNNDSLTYQFSLNVLGLTDVAEYRAFDTTVGYGKGNAGARSVSGKLPPLTRRYHVEEFEQLQLQISGAGAIGGKLDEYARKGGLAIAARIALAQAEAIEFDRVTLDDNGLAQRLTYGRSADHKIVASTLWSDTTVELLEPLLSALQVYRTNNGGQNPGVQLISQRILDALSRNAQIISDTTRSERLPTRVGFPDVISWLGDWGMTNVRIFQGNIDNKPLLSDNKVFFLPTPGANLDGTGALGTTEMGITAESIQPIYGIGAGEQSGIFAAAFDRNQPQGTDVMSTAVAIPAVRNSNAVMTIEALTPAPGTPAAAE
jgi:hypothetical protein